MIRENSARLVMYCDRCPAQLDLGVANAVKARNRTPSGWIRTGTNTHCCPLCSPSVGVAAIFAQAGGVRPQPLF